jgi:hypothetical protein
MRQKEKDIAIRQEQEVLSIFMLDDLAVRNIFLLSQTIFKDSNRDSTIPGSNISGFNTAVRNSDVIAGQARHVLSEL